MFDGLLCVNRAREIGELVVRRIFVVLMLAALGVAAALSLVRVEATASTSILPPEILDQLTIRVGSKVGVSFGLSGDETVLDCGSVARPNTFEIRGNGILDQIAEATDVAGRANDACSDAIGHRRSVVFLVLGGAGLLLVLALVSKAPRPVQVVVRQPTGATPAMAAQPGAWAPPSVAGAAAPSTVVQQRVPRRRRWWWGVAGAVGALTLGAAVVALKDDGDERFGGNPFTAPVTTEDPAAIECMTRALATADQLFEDARANSTADHENAVVNSDGDRSWLDYGTSLADVDVLDCPGEFRVAFRSFASHWQLYGQAVLESSKGFFGDDLSEDTTSQFAAQINAARAEVDRILSEVDPTHVGGSYTLG